MKIHHILRATIGFLVVLFLIPNFVFGQNSATQKTNPSILSPADRPGTVKSANDAGETNLNGNSDYSASQNGRLIPETLFLSYEKVYPGYSKLVIPPAAGKKEYLDQNKVELTLELRNKHNIKDEDLDRYIESKMDPAKLRIIKMERKKVLDEKQQSSGPETIVPELSTE